MLGIHRVTLGLLAVATVACLAPGWAGAQVATCVYARCALHIQRHPPRVVQGVGATPVADFGVFAPRIDLLSTSGDSARIHYAAFRGAYNRGAVFKVIGFVAGISSLVVFAGNPRANYPAGLGIAAVGLSTGLVGFVFAAHAQGELERSIAFYNRALPDSP